MYMKRSVVLIVFLSFFLISSTSVLADTGISTCQELQDMNNNLSEDYYLENDIDCSDTINWNSGEGFEPISVFNGSFDGNNYVISDLYININDTNAGLFGSLNNANIENVSLNNANITIMNVSNKGIGGICGVMDTSTINNVGTSGIITVYGAGDISGSDYQRVGGICGRANGIINNSFSKINILTDGGAVGLGGLVGIDTNPYLLIENSYYDGNIRHDGSQYIGGIVGYGADTDVKKSFSYGSIIGNSIFLQGTYIGGICGVYCNIYDSFSTMELNGDNTIGGLQGSGAGREIVNSYFAGSINYDTDFNINGVASSTSINSFWDLNTSDYITDDSGATGKTTIEMKDIDTFTDTTTEGLNEAWDFVGNPNDDNNNVDIWNINTFRNNGYPVLTQFNTIPSYEIHSPLNGTDFESDESIFFNVSYIDIDNPNGYIKGYWENGSLIDDVYCVTDWTYTINNLPDGTYGWYVNVSDLEYTIKSDTLYFTVGVNETIDDDGTDVIGITGNFIKNVHNSLRSMSFETNFVLAFLIIFIGSGLLAYLMNGEVGLVAMPILALGVTVFGMLPAWLGFVIFIILCILVYKLLIENKLRDGFNG